MARKKYSAELNSRVIRINLSDYALLTGLSQKLDISMAEALHLVITQQTAKEQVAVRPGLRIPVSLVTPAIAIDGSKTVLGTKIKGVRYE